MVDRYSQYTSSHYSSNNPSFSSTLLDAVYRSIDRGEEEIVVYREAMRTMTTKQNYDSESVNVRGLFKSEEEMANFQRACMIEKWMEKKVSEKVVVRTKSVTDLLQTKKSRKDRENSSSSSSDSSTVGGVGGFFSEAESYPIQRPKQIRTGGSVFPNEKLGKNHRDRRNSADQSEQKPKHEGGFLKTKSRALKIYGDLKKVKQPISPGGKLAGFLNTLFAGGNLKKPKVFSGGNCDVVDSPSLKSANTSTCSSASSFSRSCLSKTPSSGGGKYSTAAKRSVRFYPVSVIVDEDCQPCGHKSIHQENNSNNRHTTKNQTPHELDYVRTAVNEELMAHVMEKNHEVARDLLRNYQKKNQVFDDDDDDDDAASYASSDLFELDNLSAIGMDHQRYREELPVYETTHLEKNRAIANGFIL